MFLVLNRTQALCPKIIPTDEGSRIVVSQELNTPSIVWALGGHRFENLLLKGEVSTICSDNVSKQMMADVRKVFSRYCKNRWVLCFSRSISALKYSPYHYICCRKHGSRFLLARKEPLNKDILINALWMNISVGYFFKSSGQGIF